VPEASTARVSRSSACGATCVPASHPPARSRRRPSRRPRCAALTRLQVPRSQYGRAQPAGSSTAKIVTAWP